MKQLQLEPISQGVRYGSTGSPRTGEGQFLSLGIGNYHKNCKQTATIDLSWLLL